jgi:hypothetical protein
MRIEVLDAKTESAVRELEMTAFPAARLLGITQSVVTKAVYHGEKLSKNRGFQMISAG